MAVATVSLYVGDLHQEVTDAILLDAFKEFSSLASIRVCKDSSTGRSLCYGYVNFSAPQDAHRAIEVKNHSLLNGKAIRVMWSHRDPDARKSGIGNVFVKNLCDTIDNVKLQEMFQKFGTVLSCKIVTSDDGKSKGYGFVQMESENAANAAIEKLNDSIIGGKQMYVGKFIKKSERGQHEVKYTNVYVKNLDIDISDEVIKNKFSEYGKLVSFLIAKDENGASRGFGFANFENADDAKHAVEALNGSQLGSKVLYAARAQKKSEREEMLRLQFEKKRKEHMLKYQGSNLYVKNIDDEVTDDELREHFRKCGTITSAKLMRDDKGISKGFGFVCFSIPEEAIKAINVFHGFMLHKKPLYVALAQRKEERQAQLQIQYAHHMMGLTNQSAFVPGGHRLNYRAPGVVSQFPASMYQHPLGIKQGWKANNLPNPSLQIPNNLKHSRENKGNMNCHFIPQGGGHTFASYSEQPAYYVVSSKCSSIQQRAPNKSYRKMIPTAVQPILYASAHDASGSDMFSSLLAAATPAQQKQMIGERVHPLVCRHEPVLASKITGMLLEMDNSELLHLLDSPGSLAAKVEEAVEVLKLSHSKLSNHDLMHRNYHPAEVEVN